MADARPPEPRRFRDTPLGDGDAPEVERAGAGGGARERRGAGLPRAPRPAGPPDADRAPAAGAPLPAGGERTAAQPGAPSEALSPRPEGGPDLWRPGAPAPRGPRPSVFSQPEVAWPAGLLAGALPGQLLSVEWPAAAAAPPAALALFALELAWRRRAAPRANRAGVLGFGLGLFVQALDRGLALGGAPGLGQRLALWSPPTGPGELPAVLALGAPAWCLLLALLARLPTALPGRLALALLLLELGQLCGAAGLALALPGDGDLLRAWRGLGPPGLCLALAWILSSASGLPAGATPDRRRDALWLAAGLAAAGAAAGLAWSAGP